MKKTSQQKKGEGGRRGKKHILRGEATESMKVSRTFFPTSPYLKCVSFHILTHCGITPNWKNNKKVWLKRNVLIKTIHPAGHYHNTEDELYAQNGFSHSFILL